MKRRVSLIAVCLLSLGLAIGQTPSREKQVRQAVERFYAAFNSHGFEGAAEYTTEDWNHISPLGGRTRGRDATLKDLKDVHSTFLKGVTDTSKPKARKLHSTRCEQILLAGESVGG